MPVFSGGLVGYFGYDTIRFVEDHLKFSAPEKDDIGAPDIELLVSEELVVFDNLSGQVNVIVHADLTKTDGEAFALKRLDELCEKLRTPMPTPLDIASPNQITEDDFHSSFGEEGF
jgi:anthranilate synthase component 1